MKNQISHSELEHGRYLQLQQCPVGVAVGEFLLTLLLEVGLEDLSGLGVVPLETSYDVADLLRPFDGVLAVHIECAGHGDV